MDAYDDATSFDLNDPDPVESTLHKTPGTTAA